MDQLRMRFTENRGQIADTDGKLRPDILYTADAGGSRLYFTRTGMSAVFLQEDRHPQSVSEARGRADLVSESDEPMASQSAVSMRHVRMTLAGCNPNAVVTHQYEFPGYDNFYLAHCPQGIVGVRSFRQIRYQGIYNNVDLVYHAAKPQELKYEFIVAPHGDPASIRMRYEGTDALFIDDDGGLHIVSGFGEQVHRAPYTFTEDGSPVGCSYDIIGNDVSFTLGAYDHAKTLVIDPWATYYGGSGRDIIFSTRSDATGNVIAAGTTESTNLPTTSGSAQQSFAGGKDMFVVKFDGSGNHLWSTYYGGGANDEAGLEGAVDGSENIIMGVRTNSVDFPVSAGAYQASNAGGLSDAAVVKLDGSGGRVWATYLGGSGNDAVYGSGVAAAVDGSGDIYLCGTTESANFPVIAGAFQTTFGGVSDAYIVKFGGSGGLLWATYYGGSGMDIAYACTTDGNGNIVVTGLTTGNFPVTQSPPAGAADAFVLKFDTSGARLWARCFGGSGADQIWGVGTDNSGNIAAAGTTYSNDLPVTPGAFQTTRPGDQDCFTVKFDAGGGVLWATYCGGSQSDYCYSLAVSGSGNVIVGGGTFSTDFPVSNGCFQPWPGGNGDGSIIVFDESGVMQWASYLGGSDWDGVLSVTADANGNVICVGRVRSMNFPTVMPFQLSYGGGIEDGFVAEFDANGRLPAELSSLTAVSSRSGIALRWRCETETNNHGFEVQRSFTAQDGTWEARGFVPGAGSSTVVREYSFIDDAPAGSYTERSIFYRLKQIDFDGTSHYSPVVEAFPGAAPQGLAVLSLSPQPVKEEAGVRISLPEDGVASLSMVDDLGRTVATFFEKRTLSVGTHVVPIRVSGISPGVYFLQLTGTREITVQKVLVR